MTKTKGIGAMWPATYPAVEPHLVIPKDITVHFGRMWNGPSANQGKEVLILAREFFKSSLCEGSYRGLPCPELV